MQSGQELLILQNIRFKKYITGSVYSDPDFFCRKRKGIPLKNEMPCLFYVQPYGCDIVTVRC